MNVAPGGGFVPSFFNCIYLAVLGFHPLFPLVAASGGYSLFVEHELPIAEASLVAEYELQGARASAVAVHSSVAATLEL